MSQSSPTQDNAATEHTATPDTDVIVLGAGFSGIYLIKRLLDKGLTVRAFDAASDVGGTWFWNRYPGARCDSDSSVYLYSPKFDPDLAADWRWSERYPSQPEILSYIQRAADDHGLREHITFNAPVTSAEFDNDQNLWTVTTADGQSATARFLVPAIGPLNKPNLPDIPGLDEYAGEWYHTARMPENLDLTGRRVAVIGNGATAVQIVPVAARSAEQVYQFQRSASHCLPGRNHELDEDDYAELDAHREEIWAKTRTNLGGFPYADPAGEAAELTPERQREVLEEAWAKGGLPMAFASFSDLLTSRESNQVALDFISEKIHAIVRDQRVADLLTPTTPFVSKRPPIEHGYYDAFNQDNVELVDLRATPIERITADGLVTADGTTYDVDLILFATGFDAFTGGFADLNIRGANGQLLHEKWAEHLSTYLGLSVNGYPNLFMVYCGPQGPAILTNGLTLIQQQGDWIVDCLAWLHDQHIERAEVTEAAEAEFTELHESVAAQTLIPSTQSWWTGTNIPGKATGLLSFCGGFPAYAGLCEAAADGYPAYELTTGTA